MVSLLFYEREEPILCALSWGFKWIFLLVPSKMFPLQEAVREYRVRMFIGLLPILIVKLNLTASLEYWPVSPALQQLNSL